MPRRRARTAKYDISSVPQAVTLFSKGLKRQCSDRGFVRKIILANPCHCTAFFLIL